MRPLWKDYLSAVLRTGGKLVPGVAQAIEVVETVEHRREGELRHTQALSELSRVEKSIVEVIEREMKAVLAKLHQPNLSPKQLDEEMSNLYAMRSYGREPFLAEGLIANSHWYDQLRSRPNLYGRVLQDHEKPRAESFYLFIDADKTRLLEISPFALQQLLAGQKKGTPASHVIGRKDLFATRLTDVMRPSAVLTVEETLPCIPPAPSLLGGTGRTNGGVEDRVNSFLQAELARRGQTEVSAVEAAAWLDAARILADSKERPGRNLRNLLRAQMIKGARQELNGRWFIEKR